MSSKGKERYYTIEEHLLKVYDKNSRKLGFAAESTQEHQEWKERLRKVLSEISGLTKMETSDLKPEVLEVEQCDGYLRKKVIIQTEPDVWMPTYVLIPDDLEEQEKRACIIAPHGHGGGGKEGVAGRTELLPIKEGLKKYNADYGAELVQEGYVVFCPDARGAGERRESMLQGNKPEEVLGSSCNELNNIAISLGQSLMGMWTWDLKRLIDYIETCSICNSEAIGCCGFSGGGWQTLWLTALDDRVKCAVVSGYFHGFKGTIFKTNKCGCNYIPHLWEYIDVGDLGALIAPRPLLIESGAKDPLNGARGLEDVREQVEITRGAYQLYGSEQKLYHHIFDGVHRWNGEKTFEFFKRWLQN